MDASALIRKLVHFEEEVRTEYGQPVSPPLRRIAVGAVIANPCLSAGATADLGDLVAVSEQLGTELTRRVLDRLGDSSGMRAYAKAIDRWATALAHLGIPAMNRASVSDIPYGRFDSGSWVNDVDPSSFQTLMWRWPDDPVHVWSGFAMKEIPQPFR